MQLYVSMHLPGHDTGLEGGCGQEGGVGRQGQGGKRGDEEGDEEIAALRR